MDGNPSTPELDARCQVIDVYADAQKQQHQTALQACAVNAAPPCWTLVDDVNCPRGQEARRDPRRRSAPRRPQHQHFLRLVHRRRGSPGVPVRTIARWALVVAVPLAGACGDRPRDPTGAGSDAGRTQRLPRVVDQQGRHPVHGRQLAVDEGFARPADRAISVVHRSVEAGSDARRLRRGAARYPRRRRLVGYRAGGIRRAGEEMSLWR